VLLGCDACPNGVEGAGPKVAKDLLDKYCYLSGVMLHDALAEAISTMKGAIVKDKESVLCLAKSILYEKTNDGWIHGRPTEF
jgi:5'-3' exonuclease